MITSSNFAGRCTGSSVGLAPFKILSTQAAAHRKKAEHFLEPHPCLSPQMCGNRRSGLPRQLATREGLSMEPSELAFSRGRPLVGEMLVCP